MPNVFVINDNPDVFIDAYDGEQFKFHGKPEKKESRSEREDRAVRIPYDAAQHIFGFECGENANEQNKILLARCSRRGLTIGQTYTPNNELSLFDTSGQALKWISNFKITHAKEIMVIPEEVDNTTVVVEGPDLSGEQDKKKK